MTNRNGYGSKALDEFLSSLDWNNQPPLTEDYIERRLREHPNETASYHLPGNRYLIVRKDGYRVLADHLEDLLGERIPERYTWMLSEDQSEVYGRERDKLVLFHRSGALSPNEYVFLLQELNERHRESRAPALNRRR